MSKLVAGCLLALVILAPVGAALAADAEVEELKRQVEILMQRVQELERERSKPAPPAPAQEKPPEPRTPSVWLPGA